MSLTLFLLATLGIGWTFNYYVQKYKYKRIENIMSAMCMVYLELKKNNSLEQVLEKYHVYLSGVFNSTNSLEIDTPDKRISFSKYNKYQLYYSNITIDANGEFKCTITDYKTQIRNSDDLICSALRFIGSECKDEFGHDGLQFTLIIPPQWVYMHKHIINTAKFLNVQEVKLKPLNL